MDSAFQDYSTASNNDIKKMVDSLLDGLDAQRADLPGVLERLAGARTSMWSSDRLAEVIVDTNGVVVDVRLAPNAFQAGPPAALARSIAEAARSAAITAQARRAEILAPLTELTGALPDLPDLFPGAPSLREIREIVDKAALAAVAEAEQHELDRER